MASLGCKLSITHPINTKPNTPSPSFFHFLFLPHFPHRLPSALSFSPPSRDLRRPKARWRRPPSPIPSHLFIFSSPQIHVKQALRLSQQTHPTSLALLRSSPELQGPAEQAAVGVSTGAVSLFPFTVIIIKSVTPSSLRLLRSSFFPATPTFSGESPPPFILELRKHFLPLFDLVFGFLFLKT